MAVPSSGELKLWDTLWNQELGGSQGENSLHSASVYAGFSTPDALSDFYGWSDVEVPTVSTQSMTSVTQSSMTARVCVSDTGNENPTYGVYFGTNSSAPTNNTKVTGGTGGVGLYNISRTGLSYNTTYYAWGWACNSAGEAVGSRVQATTPFPPFSATFSSSRITAQNADASGFTSNVKAFAYRNPYSGAWTNYAGPSGTFGTTNFTKSSATNTCNFGNAHGYNAPGGTPTTDVGVITSPGHFSATSGNQHSNAHKVGSNNYGYRNSNSQIFYCYSP